MELTPEQKTTAQLLVAENRELFQQLMELNHELDEQLSRRGHGLNRIQQRKRASQKTVAEKLAAKVEQQRKINEELAKQLSVLDVASGTGDLQQRVSDLTMKCRELRDENRGLENIFSNQQVTMAVVERIEKEMKKAKTDHHETLLRIKEATKQFKEAREAAMEEYRHLQRSENKVESKLKVQNMAEHSAGQLQELCVAREKTVQRIKEEILSLSKTSIDRQKSRSVQERRAKELDDLRAEMLLLREKLEALQIDEETL
jgi:hypothetical protein